MRSSIGGVESPETVADGPETLTVLVYSDDPATRERVMLAVGRRPTRDLGHIDYVEIDDGDAVVREIDAGGIDLAVLDGEAWPTGGMGLCRQLKDEVADVPPIVIVVGRRDDAWLAAWSRADGTLAHPLDPVTAAATVADLLRARARGVPARRR